MNLKSIIQLSLFVLFIAFIIVLVTKQEAGRKELYKSALRGKVVSSEKGEKGFYDIKFINVDEVGRLTFSYSDSSIKAFTGDSIYKEPNSSTFYVKSYDAPAFVKLELLDAW